jgi:hypothetical protein
MVRKRGWKSAPVHCETVSAPAHTLEHLVDLSARLVICSPSSYVCAAHWALRHAVPLLEVHHLLQSRLVMVRATRASARNLPQLQMQIETCPVDQPTNCGAAQRRALAAGGGWDGRAGRSAEAVRRGGGRGASTPSEGARRTRGCCGLARGVSAVQSGDAERCTRGTRVPERARVPPVRLVGPPWGRLTASDMIKFALAR